MPDAITAWQCIVCGYIHQGAEPPESCPACGASREEFEPVSEGTSSAAEFQEEAAKTPRVVVIGAGIAGIAAVESLRAASPSAEITLISRETELPYYRLNLTRYLAGEIKRENLPIHPAAWYKEQNVQLLLGEEVRKLDLEGHAIVLRNDNRLPFDKLLLAAGANPFIPPIPGSDREGVTTLRTLRDADYLLAACQSRARCVCIGGGILGLETAGALARRGAKVTLLEGHGWLLPRQLNQRAGEILGDHVRRLGIILRNKAKTREILGNDRVEGVLLEDGSTIPADLVVIATGIRANSSLAQEAGLEVKHGVVVDGRLTTSHPDVLAAGDVAEHKGVVYGLWTASQAQGTIAGKNLAGDNADFGGLPRSNTLKVLGLDMFSIGQIMPEDASFQVTEEEAEGGYSRFVFHENRLVGAILLGDIRLMSATKKAVEEKRDCSSLLRNSPTAQTVIEHFGGMGASKLPARSALLMSESPSSQVSEPSTNQEGLPFRQVGDHSGAGRRRSSMIDFASHERFMRRAIALAAANPSAPFAAVLVNIGTNEIVAEGINRQGESPTWHGEIDAINRCAALGRDINWTGLRLYTTAEPCCMCQGAILWAGIPEVVFGTSIRTLKQLGWKQIDIEAEEVTRRTAFAQCRLIGGVLEAECDQLFRRAVGTTGERFS